MDKFDPAVLAPDQVTVELEIGSSVLMAYGSVLRNFIHLKVMNFILIFKKSKCQIMY